MKYECNIRCNLHKKFLIKRILKNIQKKKGLFQFFFYHQLDILSSKQYFYDDWTHHVYDGKDILDDYDKFYEFIKETRIIDDFVMVIFDDFKSYRYTYETNFSYLRKGFCYTFVFLGEGNTLPNYFCRDNGDYPNFNYLHNSYSIDFSTSIKDENDDISTELAFLFSRPT